MGGERFPEHHEVPAPALHLRDRPGAPTRDQLTSVVQLYKALGGGWTPEAGPTPGR